MEKSQVSMTNKKPKAVRLHAVRKPVAASLKEAGLVLGESQGEDKLGQEALTMEIDGDYRSIKDVKPTSKRSLKYAVDVAP
jgi:hypothetical protein